VGDNLFERLRLKHWQTMRRIISGWHVYTIYRDYIVYIIFTSYLHHVYIIFTSCLHHIYIVFTLCLHYVYIMFTSWLHYVYIVFTSCLHRVYIIYGSLHSFLFRFVQLLLSNVEYFSRAVQIYIYIFFYIIVFICMLDCNSKERNKAILERIITRCLD